MGTVANIVTGKASVYVKAYGTGSNNPVSANAVAWDTWTQFGFKTEDGVSLEYSPEFFDVLVEEHHAPVMKELTGQEAKVSFTLKESELSAIQYAMTGSVYTAGSVAGTNENSLTIGSGTADYLSLGVEGLDQAGNEIVVFLPKVVSVGAVQVAFAKGQTANWLHEFAVMCDPTESADEELIQIYQITSGA